MQYSLCLSAMGRDWQHCKVLEYSFHGMQWGLRCVCIIAWGQLLPFSGSGRLSVGDFLLVLLCGLGWAYISCPPYTTQDA